MNKIVKLVINKGIINIILVKVQAMPESYDVAIYEKTIKIGLNNLYFSFKSKKRIEKRFSQRRAHLIKEY